MNEVVKITPDKQIAVADPFSPEIYHTTPDTIISSMMTRKDAHISAFDALGNLDEAPLEAVKECRRAIEDDDALLKDYEKTMLDALLNLSGFKAVQVQMKGTKARIDPLSVRGKFAELVNALKAREDAEKVAEPTHSYVVQMDVTDADFKKVIVLLAKAGAAYRYVSADNIDKDADAAFKKLGWKNN